MGYLESKDHTMWSDFVIYEATDSGLRDWDLKGAFQNGYTMSNDRQYKMVQKAMAMSMIYNKLWSERSAEFFITDGISDLVTGYPVDQEKYRKYARTM